MFRKYFLSYVFILSVLVVDSMAQGVLFSEYRLILNSNAVTSIYMSNPTDTPYNYSISIEDKVMQENGDVLDLSPDSVFAASLKPYLRVFPRNILVEPENSQELQIQLKTPSSLPDGEYRSFLKFTPREPNMEVIDSTSQEGVKMAIKFQMSTMIPVIFRKNATVENVFVDGVSLTPSQDNQAYDLNLNINRVGTRTVYGKIHVRGTSNGRVVDVVSPNGSYAIYTEIPVLKTVLPIDISGLDRDASGAVNLDISYIDSENKYVKNPMVWCQGLYKVIVPELVN